MPGKTSTAFQGAKTPEVKVQRPAIPQSAADLFFF